MINPNQAREVLDKAYELLKDMLTSEQKDIALKLLWKQRDEYAKAYHKAADLAAAIYHQHLQPGSMDLEAADKAGMIPKDQLANGAQYVGYCRNAYVAKWDGRQQRFYYLRTKWGHTFSESIPHPVDDEKFDIFCPVKLIG